MRLRINEQYRISSDANQWILQKVRTRKGVEDWESISFHSAIDDLIQDLGHRMVRESDATTLAEALVAIENVTTTLSQALTTQKETLKETSLGRMKDGE